MAIKELFYDNRPRVLLDPRASQRIDPRFTFTRDSVGTFVDDSGIVQTASANEPRFDHNPVTGESLGLLLENQSTNYKKQSSDLTDTTSGSWASGATNMTRVNETINGPAGLQQYTKITAIPGNNKIIGGLTFMPSNNGDDVVLSIYIQRGNLDYFWFAKQHQNSSFSPVYFDFNEVKAYINYGQPGLTVPPGDCTIKDLGGGWFYLAFTVKEKGPGASQRMMLIPLNEKYPTTSGSGVPTATGTTEYYYAWGAQCEHLKKRPTSYIPTATSAVTRAQDLVSVETPLPATGSIYIDARAISANENDTLLSLKNDSNDKVDLAYLSNTATYNSLALIANYDGVSKSSLPLPVPTTDRERNIITYGANNYQYGRDSSRFAPSLSSSVPTGLNKLSIGHDAVDPTKAFNGYINTVYAWSGELTPEVAKALVRGEIDAINADTYDPTGPAGSLALVINTQGAAANGEKTFTLPAESVATDNDIVITWGDGTESGLDGAAAELGAIGLTHDYPSAGIYPVSVEGKMQNIKYNNNISNKDDLLLIAAWGTDDMLTSPSTMNGAFFGCSQMDFSSSARNTNRPNTSAVTDWTNAFRDCSSITGTFPSFDFTAATAFSSTWRGCSSLASVPAIFVADGDVTQNVTSFSNAWNGCNSFTSFPLINTSSGTIFGNAWNGCSSLTSFPLINTSSGTSFDSTWRDCSSLTSFPLINTSSGTNFLQAWYGCSGLTSFPLINTSSGTSFDSTWRDCSSLTSFPLINTSSGTNFSNAWNGCSSLTSFPLINTSSGTGFGSAWRDCSSLTSFPLINTSSGTIFGNAWNGCSSLTSFPLIITSLGTSFSGAWNGCSSLTSFPLIDTSSSTNFGDAWDGCSSLTDFPANFFDSWAATPVDECFYLTWDGCSSLTATSVDNILVSIAASGVSAPSGTDTNDKKITIDYDGTPLPGTTATAIATLQSRDWEIYLNNVLQ
jgi:hypothetical protein